MELDDDDYALLGYGERTYESSEWLRAAAVRHAQLLRAWRKYHRSEQGKETRRKAQVVYEKTQKGKATRARYLETEKGKDANRRSSLSYYYRNRERLLQKAREWREKNPNYMAERGRAHRGKRKQPGR